MLICFRVDASVNIGSGHVVRCLTLAEVLKERGVDIVFLTRNTAGNYGDFIERKGFRCVKMPSAEHSHGDRDTESAVDDQTPFSPHIDARQSIEIILSFHRPIDWLIVDHYGLDAEWERSLRPCVDRIMVVDDLANRPHDCDLILDQNYYRFAETRYDGLVPSRCIKLLGPKYVLLRREFLNARRFAKSRSGEVGRILIFLGGSDPEDVTSRVLQAFLLLGLRDVILDVVVGASNVHCREIERLCGRLENARFHCQIDNMAELIAAADLSVGSGGSVTWERCVLGLPTLTVVIADNQREMTEDVAALGLVWYLGRSTQLSAEDFAREIRVALNSPARLCEMSAAAMRFMSNHLGASTNLVVEALLGRA